jgi:hypothetical protein
LKIDIFMIFKITLILILFGKADALDLPSTQGSPLTYSFLAAAKRVTGTKGFESKTGKDASKRSACACGEVIKNRCF